MLIGFTGLHAAGKSYFLNRLSERFGFKVYDKKQILRRLYFQETGKTDEKFNLWYGDKFQEDPYAILERILSFIPEDEDAILDAIHSSYEWEIIEDLRPESYLALMVTPRELREIRWTQREINPSIDLTSHDNKRLVYWHNQHAERSCLPAHASWAFCGAATEELNVRSFGEFLNYIKNKEEINKPENVQKLVKKREQDG